MSETGKIRFVIPGRAVDVPRRPDEPRELMVLASARRGSEGEVVLEAEPGDQVKLELVNGPELSLRPETARVLFEAQRSEGALRGAVAGAAGGVRAPTRLAWAGPPSAAPSRGSASVAAGVVMRAFRLIKGVISPADALAEAGAGLLAREVTRRVDRQAAPGLYALSTDVLRPAAVNLSGESRAPTDTPLLVFVHGTFSTVTGGFGKLWSEHPALVRDLARHYRGGLYGFEHPTLGASPLANALELVNALPKGARVHFLTHSRGGLVAEALARLGPNPQASAQDASLFEAPRYEQQARELQKLAEALRARNVQVDRIVRVGGPTRGTLLASGRLDAYLSVLQWSLTLAGIPIAPDVVNFLSEVASRRADPTELPGLEAMMPQSALVRWLHASDEPLAGDLRVVAGDVQGDSVTSWLKTLVSDAFFWTDNDLVVQTRSMYGGPPRVSGSMFWLERGAKVGHNGYFAQAATARAITAALIQPAPEGFQPIGPRSSAGLDSSGRRDARPARSTVAAASRPALVLLPGILGSHLDVGGQRIWFGPRFFNGLDRLAYVPADPKVSAGGVLGWVYGRLIEHLEQHYEVLPFPFDWRRPIEEEARRLAQVLTRAMDERNVTRQPVRMLAHSMGGLVARALEFADPDAWQQFLSRSGSRLLMLGTPNAGSWAPMQVLSGDSFLGDVLDSVGVLFDDARARRLFAALPGFLQLQAGLDPSTGLSRSERWRELAEGDRRVLSLTLLWHSLEIQKRAADWGIPSQDVLDGAMDFQRKLASQRLRGDRVVMVLGSAKSTPSGFSVNTAGNVDYASVANEGDGTVPQALALLDGVPAWQALATRHMALAQNRQLFEGYSVLLEHGTLPASRLFQPVASATNGSRGGISPEAPASLSMDRMARRRGFAPETLTEPLQPTSVAEHGAAREDGEAGVPELRLAVTNGNLTFVSQPLLLGHYRSLGLSGAEEQMDELIGKTMSQSLDMRRYPAGLGSCQVFNNLQSAPHNPFAAPRPKAVVVVGLGEEGELRPPGLSLSVEQAVIAYSQVVAEGAERTSSFELATTLLGSGGIGMAVAGSAHAVAHGVRSANVKLLRQGWPIVSRLEFVELYEDRATEALRALSEEALGAPTRFSLEPWLRSGTNPLPRPEHASYRGAPYDFVSAVRGSPLEGEERITYTMDTRRARTEERATSAPLGILRSLIASAIETDRKEAGRALFQLLVPRELDTSLGGSDAILLEVDDLTAPIPWELLSTDSDEPGAEPWAIRTKLLRKRRVEKFREQPVDSGRQAGVLVVGAPKCDETKYPRLMGALQEAQAVAALFSESIALFEAEAPAVISALLEGPYRLVHIAGHGKEDGSGVVLSDDNVLRHSLVGQMRHVPELVFVNCCHSGREVLGAKLGGNALGIERPQFAATIAEKLISIGVRCVVATGWAVDDDAAERFAHEFYTALGKGQPFVEAVSVARRTTFRAFPHSNTWAAYQCYGDPDWMLLTPGDDQGQAEHGAARGTAQRRPPILSPSTLRVALHAAAMSGQFSDDKRQRSLERLAELEHECTERSGSDGAAAEAFAIAYAKLGENEKAIVWYERAADCEDGGVSQRGIQQLGNLRVLQAAERVEAAHRSWRADPVDEALTRVIGEARDEIDRTARRLGNLFEMHSTIELACLLGSTQKRIAMIEQVASRAFGQRSERWSTAVEKTIGHYALAEQRARESDQPVFYALWNRLAAEYVGARLRGEKYSPGEELCEELHDDIERRSKAAPDFWSLVQHQELFAFRALCKGELSSAVRDVTRQLADLHQRLASPRSWRSVRDQWRFMLRADAPGAAAETAAAHELLDVLERYGEGTPA